MTLGDLQNRFVALLRKRVRNGELTERGLARMVGVSQPHMHNVLHGKRSFSVETTDEMISTIAQTLVGSGEAMRGEEIVIASAVPPNRPTFGASMMQIHRL